MHNTFLTNLKRKKLILVVQIITHVPEIIYYKDSFTATRPIKKEVSHIF